MAKIKNVSFKDNIIIKNQYNTSSNKIKEIFPFDINFEKKNASELASLSFIGTLLLTFQNWNKVAKKSTKYKLGYYSSATALSILASTGAMTVYKTLKNISKKEIKK